MNQNRNNNRRRGRGGNRGQGGGNQSNRIDSRARGNAPQLLEKYKKLAHDASLNGDRVQTEYYLQFADHYFRVIADSRAQRDEQRPRRDNERDYGQGQAFEDGEDFEEIEEADRGRNRSRREPDEDREDAREDRAGAEEGGRGAEGEAAASADDNPFTRDARARRSRGRGRKPAAASEETSEGEAGFDPGRLPPSIAREDETPPRRTRGRKPRPADDGDAEALAAAS